MDDLCDEFVHFWGLRDWIVWSVSQNELLEIRSYRGVNTNTI